MKKILQALDGASTKPVEGSSDMKKFLKLVSETDLNQPAQDPKYVEYAQLMAKYDMLAKEMTPDNSGIEKGASPEAIASVNAIKAKAQQLAGANLQAWEQTRQKENNDSMAQATANQSAMAGQLEDMESSLPTEQMSESSMTALLQIVTEGKNTKTNRFSQAENIVYMNTPKPKPVKLDENPSLFKTYLKLVEEEDINQIDNLKNKLDEHLQEVKSQEPPKPRNPVAKNANAAIGGGAAGAHKDKKKAAKSGDVKHKKQSIPMDEQDLSEEKIKGVDGKACWKGKRYAGKVKKADGTYKDKCVPVNEGDE